jgi:transcriptional regulator with XRE-family HTH domain
VSLLSRINLVKKLLESRKFRDAYVYEHIRNGLPFQIRALRKDRNWSQSELAEAAKTSRTVITRIEDPNYGKLTLKTLSAVASAFDVALLVKFVPFSRLLREYEDVSSEALNAKDVLSEKQQLQRWASAANTVAYASTDLRGFQLQLGFAQTIPTEASSSNTTSGGLKPEVSGTGTINVVSIKTRRPLGQKRKTRRMTAPTRLAKTA